MRGKHINDIQLLLNLAFTLMVIHIADCKQANSIQPFKNFVTISQIQQPITSEVTLNCQGLSRVIFNIQKLATTQIQNFHSTKSLMLRLDYEPNKCISAQQDILIPKQTHEIQVTFNKTCCNLFTNSSAESVKLITTVRQAYVIFGFPISSRFFNVAVPTIVGILATVLFEILFNRKVDFKQLNYSTLMKEKV